MPPRARAFFRWSYIALASYSYFAETVQHFRGVNPRFVADGSTFDQRPELTIGIRYAMIAVLLSFAAGVWISVNQSRFVGLGGNLI